MKRAFKNFIYYLSNTDPQMVKHFSPQHRFIPDLIGMSVLLAALTSTASVGYFLASVFGNHSQQYVVVPLGATLYFFIIITLDKGLFLAKSGKSLLLRAGIVLALVSVTSVPFKLALQDSKIKTIMANSHKQKQATAYRDVAKLKADYRARKQSLNREMNQLQNEKSRMERLRNAEDTGLKLNGRSTGVQGKGRKWKQYNGQVKVLEKRIENLQKTINNQDDENTRQTTIAEEYFNKIVPEQDQSFISRYIAFKKVLNTSDEHERVAIKEFNFAMYLFFVFIELSPVFLKLFIGKENHIARELAEEAIFEIEILRRRRAYMMEALELAAPISIDRNQITKHDVDNHIDKANEVLEQNKNNYR